MTRCASDGSIPLTPEEPRRLPGGQLEVLAPAFVALSEDQAERAVRALAELLVAAAERAGGASP